METKAGRRRPGLSFFYRVFCWCSGARLYLLEKCPSDLNKYLGIGAVILMTGLMASLSGGYAIYTVFRSYPVAILFGLLWGILIFFLDFFLVSSLKKQDKVKHELPFAAPRFVLAILIAIVISKPVELKLFQREINVEIESMRSVKNREFSKVVGQEFGDLYGLIAENDRLKKEISDKEEVRNSLFKLVIAEAEGESPTRRIGKGPVYAEKRQEFNASDKELSETKLRNYSLIKENNLRIAKLQTSRDARMREALDASAESDGFLDRLQAMSNLKDKSFIVSMTSWFITLLFIVIESAPIIVKLLSKKGPYDYLLEAEEFSKEAEASMIIENIRFGHEDSLDVDREIARIKFKSEIMLQSEFISSEADVRRELFKRRLKTVSSKGKLAPQDIKLVSAEEDVTEDKLADVVNTPPVEDSSSTPASISEEKEVNNPNMNEAPTSLDQNEELPLSVFDEKKMAKN